MLKVASSLPRLPLPRRIFLSKMSTTAAAPLCPKFIPVEHSEITSISKPDGLKFRLVSYNILAQVENSFPGNFDSYQEPQGRFSLLAELVVEEKIEYNDLVNSIQDGTAMHADKDNDTLASVNKDTEPNKGLPQKDTDGHHGDPNDPCVRLKRDCVGIMAAFKLKDPSDHVVIVANTHLYWDPNWADVKLAQAKYLLSRLAQFKTLVSDKFECIPSVIVAGDFNSTPGDKVYQYLVSGSSSMGGSPECFEDVPIPLCSVYALTRGEPPFTNYTPGFTGTLDYIFFSPSGDNIKPVSFLELSEPESPDVLGGLPNYHHPSDHLPIGAEFEVV